MSGLEDVVVDDDGAVVSNPADADDYDQFPDAVEGPFRKLKEKFKLEKKTDGRAFTFTLHDYTTGDVEYLKDIYDEKPLTYICFGAEFCPKTGRPHLQGYIHFKSVKKVHQVKNLLPRSVHVEYAEKGAPANRAYCTKTRDACPPKRPLPDVPNLHFWEKGVMPMSNKTKGEMERARWSLARQMAREGRFNEIPDDIYMRCKRVCKEIYFEERLEAQPKVLDRYYHLWLWGPTGTGKSHKAREVFPDYYDKLTNKWWDCYNFEETILIDDIEPDHAKYFGGFLKRWADKWPFRAEVKGSTISIRPKRIVITSNFEIADIFPDSRTHLPLLDRFNVVHFNNYFGVPKRVKVPWNVQLLEAKAGLLALDAASQLSQNGEDSVQLLSPEDLAEFQVVNPEIVEENEDELELEMPDGFFS